MKRVALIVACVLALVQLSRGQKLPTRCQDTGTSSGSVIEELKKLDRELDDASERGDKTVFQRGLAEEMISVSPDGTIRKKEDVLQDVQPPKAGSKLSIIAGDIQVYSFGDTAIISSSKTIKWERSHGSSSDQYRETNTLCARTVVGNSSRRSNLMRLRLTRPRTST